MCLCPETGHMMRTPRHVFLPRTRTHDEDTTTCVLAQNHDTWWGHHDMCTCQGPGHRVRTPWHVSLARTRTHNELQVSLPRRLAHSRSGHTCHKSRSARLGHKECYCLSFEAEVRRRQAKGGTKGRSSSKISSPFSTELFQGKNFYIVSHTSLYGMNLSSVRSYKVIP